MIEERVIYTLEEASPFVQKAMLAWEKGDLLALSDWYDQDLVGHVNNELFSYQGVVK